MEVIIGDKVYIMSKEEYEKLQNCIKENTKGFKVVNVVEVNKGSKGDIENFDELAYKFS